MYRTIQVNEITGGVNMSVQVSSYVLISTLRQHLSSRTKVSVNFTFEEEYIKIQSINDYVFDTTIKGNYTSDMIGESFSVMIDRSIDLLQDDEGVTKIIKIGDKVIFEQDNITIPFFTAFEERVNIAINSLSMCGSVSLSNISTITRGFRKLLNLTKSLDVGAPSVVISNGHYYCLYHNMMLIGNVPVALPDAVIPYNTFNSLSKNLTGSSVNIYQDPSVSMLVLETSAKSIVMVTYTKPNMEIILAINKKISELRYIGNYDLKSIKTMELVYKCFNKETITMSFYEDYSIGFLLSVTDGKTIKAGAKDINTNANIIVSTAQLDALYKVFSEVSKVDVYVGHDVVYLKDVNGTQVLMSGMTF